MPMLLDREAGALGCVQKTFDRGEQESVLNLVFHNEKPPILMIIR